MFDSRAVAKSAAKLALEMGRVLGDSKVIDDRDLLESYAVDKSHCEPRMPDFAVRVVHETDVIAVLEAAQRLSVPVVARGAGTGKSGGAIPLYGGVVLDTSAMNQIEEIDRDNMLAVVAPGVITGDLCKAVEAEGLFYPPDPNSLDTCTIGGNIAHNAGGPRAYKYGVTREYVKEVRAVLMGGGVCSAGVRTVKGVAGYDIRALMVGSEGTLGVFTRATVRLVHNPQEIATLLIPMPDEVSAGKAISAIVASRQVPRVMEFLDSVVVDVLRREGIAGIDDRTGAVLLVEMDGDDEVRVEEDVLALSELCEAAGAIEVFMARHGAEREKLWEARRLMSDALADTAAHKVSEDIVVPRSRAAEVLVGLKALGRTFGVTVAAYGHGGDGNYHVNVLWDDDEFDPRELVGRVFRLTLELGGTITGEHGVGIAKKPYLPWELGTSEMAVQRAVKAALDPLGLLNPGKIFDR